ARCGAIECRLAASPTARISTTSSRSSRSTSESHAARTRSKEPVMATRLKEVDAVVVGMGWTGSILARELTKAGLNVVGLERGPDRVPGNDFVLRAVRDELRYGRRSEFIADNSLETVTFRHFPNESALPMRRWGAFSPGEGVGGAGMHWTGHHWRFLPSDFVLKSHTLTRHGASVIPHYMTIQDLGVTYHQLLPLFAHL